MYAIAVYRGGDLILHSYSYDLIEALTHVRTFDHMEDTYYIFPIKSWEWLKGISKDDPNYSRFIKRHGINASFVLGKVR